MRSREIRVVSLLLLCAIATLANHPATGRSQTETSRIAPWTVVPSPTQSAEPAGGGSGHVVWSSFFRISPVPGDTFNVRYDPARIAYTQDVLMGLAVQVTSAQVGDMWSWYYDAPGSASNPVVCDFFLSPPGGLYNTSNNVELVSPCVGPPQNHTYQDFAGGCPCSFLIASPAGIYPTGAVPGAWAARVDYRRIDEQLHITLVTPNVASTTFDLRKPPSILLIPGWRSSCGAKSSLSSGLISEIGLNTLRVYCFKYDSEEGVKAPQGKLKKEVAAWRAQLGLQASDPIDIVAHSMGGLVARYAIEVNHSLGTVNSLSMLGTPNFGSGGFTVAKHLCAGVASRIVPGIFSGPVCHATSSLANHILGTPDLFSDSARDMQPKSKLLRQLNENFSLPSSPIYRVYFGLNDSFFSPFHPFVPGDCIVSRQSAIGNGIFSSVASSFTHTSHTQSSLLLWFCAATPITNDDDVRAAVETTIRDTSGGGGGQGSTASFNGPPDEGIPYEAYQLDYVTPGQQKTFRMSIPSGWPSAAFEVMWLNDETGPQLGVTLRRQDDQVVNSTDSDVLDRIDVTADGFLNVLAKGFHMNAPQIGLWQVTVTGDSVPAAGQAFVVAVIPQSQVSLGVDVDQPVVSPGASEAITASLYDGQTVIAAASLSAQVLAPDGSNVSVQLRDDGTYPDKTAGDKTYTGTFSNTSSCGGYRIVSVASEASSEGNVTRIQTGYFEVEVAGSDGRDPCNADDDGDGLTDVQELTTFGSDPVSVDGDGDGCPDVSEIGQGLDPANPWDFWNPTSDGLNRVDDILLVVSQFFKDKYLAGTSLTLNPKYTEITDRTLNGPPNGLQRVDDILVMVRFFFHDCP